MPGSSRNVRCQGLRRRGGEQGRYRSPVVGSAVFVCSKVFHGVVMAIDVTTPMDVGSTSMSEMPVVDVPEMATAWASAAAGPLRTSRAAVEKTSGRPAVSAGRPEHPGPATRGPVTGS